MLVQGLGAYLFSWKAVMELRSALQQNGEAWLQSMLEMLLKGGEGLAIGPSIFTSSLDLGHRKA